MTIHGEPREWLDSALSATPTDACIDWPFSCGGDGYPQIWDPERNTMRKVSHIVLEASGHPRPPGPASKALHSCDRPVCINGGHLRWGSDKENVNDMDSRGRRVIAPCQGGRNGRAVLNEDDVRQILSRHAAGTIMEDLASEFGVARSTISAICRRETWKHVAKDWRALAGDPR